MILKIIHIFVIAVAYLTAVGYLLFRLVQTFSRNGRWFKTTCWIFGILSVALITVLFLRIFNLGSWFLPFQTFSYLWMTAVLYALLLTVAFDVCRWILPLVRPLYMKIGPYMPKIRKGYVLFVIVVVCFIIGYGLSHFPNPKVTELTIEMEKPVPDWTVVAVGDLHLGTMSPEVLQQHVKTINALNPDLILLLGDQFVINWREVVPLGYASVLQQLHASHGVYAIHGNHDGIHQFSRNDDPRVGRLFEYLKINMLEDEVAVVGDQLALVGRADSSRMYDRATLPSLMRSVPAALPTILLDHQPSDLSQAKACGIDLQLSGHTHNGQLFPMNLWQRVKSLFNSKLYYGYRQDSGTQYYVTSGLGASGAPIRVGTDGEIVVIHLKQRE